MKKIIAFLPVIAVITVLSFSFLKKGVNFSADNVSIFKVPLVCNAAPHIGCGSESKPILLEFEKDANVVSAWLNRTGTEMAVVWKDDMKKEDKSAKVKAVFEKYGVSYEELTGEEYNKSFEGFASGKDWYKDTDVDKLSEEEAWTIAGRVAEGVKSKVELSADKEEKLKADVAEFCKTVFFAAGTEKEQCDHQGLIEGFYGKAGAYLNEKEMNALKEVVGSMIEVRDSKKDDCCKDRKKNR